MESKHEPATETDNQNRQTNNNKPRLCISTSNTHLQHSQLAVQNSYISHKNNIFYYYAPVKKWPSETDTFRELEQFWLHIVSDANNE